MGFKLKSYKELVAMTKEKLDETLLPLRVRGAKNRADAEVLKIEEEMLKLETQINEECAKKDVDFTKACDLIDKFELAERRLKQIKELVTALFPAKEKGE